MLKVNGNNIFENNTYSWQSWSADVLQIPSEVFTAFNNMELVGKKIANIRAVGRAYNLNTDSILSTLYNNLINKDNFIFDEENWQNIPATYPCTAQLDEPIIFFLDNSDRLEIDFSEGSSVRMSKNCLPSDIIAGTCDNNFDASKLFANCIGEQIIGLDVESTDEFPDFTGSYGIDLSEEYDEYIAAICIHLSNFKMIRFSPFFDYGDVCLCDNHGKHLEVTLSELKQSMLD
jgi:hypothetical protein